jgi:hypothetical protein
MMINLNDSDANRILVHFKIKHLLHYTTPYTICQYVTPKFLLRHKWKNIPPTTSVEYFSQITDKVYLRHEIGFVFY